MCYLKLDKSSLILSKEPKITIENIDVFEKHYCFTSSEYAAISAFGITDLGKNMKLLKMEGLRLMENILLIHIAV